MTFNFDARLRVGFHPFGIVAENRLPVDTQVGAVEFIVNVLQRAALGGVTSATPRLQRLHSGGRVCGASLGVAATPWVKPGKETFWVAPQPPSNKGNTSAKQRRKLYQRPNTLRHLQSVLNNTKEFGAFILAISLGVVKDFLCPTTLTVLARVSCASVSEFDGGAGT